MSSKKLIQVKKFVKKKTKNIKDPQHSWDHFHRTANYAIKIIKSLGLKDKLDMNLLLATCYLHDINHAYYSPSPFNYFFETKRSKSVLPKVLDELKIVEKEKRIITNAIYSSSFSFPFRNLNKEKDLYTRILQDADTLDFFNKERIKSFEKAKRKFVFYRFLGLFSGWAIKSGRKNLEKYLNFPELAKEPYVQKS